MKGRLCLTNSDMLAHVSTTDYDSLCSCRAEHVSLYTEVGWRPGNALLEPLTAESWHYTTALSDHQVTGHVLVGTVLQAVAICIAPCQQQILINVSVAGATSRSSRTSNSDKPLTFVALLCQWSNAVKAAAWDVLSSTHPGTFNCMRSWTNVHCNVNHRGLL